VVLVEVRIVGGSVLKWCGCELSLTDLPNEIIDPVAILAVVAYRDAKLFKVWNVLWVAPGA
jgi:hypothetical protein